MKTVKLLLAFLLLFSLKGKCQLTDQERTENVKAIVESKEYKFIPVSATTMKGNTTQLEPGYEVRIMNDSVSVDLPFFEEGYAVAFGAADDKVKYHSKKYAYKSEATKKGGWEVTVTPEKDPKINKFYLTVKSDGTCVLRMFLSGKDPMKYNGAISDIILK